MVFRFVFALILLRTALAREVMQLPWSICLSVCFHSIFGTDWPLTVNTCVWVGHDHSSQGIEGQGHRSRSRSWVRNAVGPTSIEGSFFLVLYVNIRSSCSAPVMSTFRKLWRQLLWHVVQTRPMTDLCWKCQQNNDSVQHSANLPDAVKTEQVKWQEAHLSIVHQVSEWVVC